MTKTINVELFGRDNVIATFKLSGSTFVDVNFQASGCQKFLSQLDNFRTLLLKLPESERNVQEPSAKMLEIYSTLNRQDHSAILLRELVLRLRDQFELPYKEAELCHCRAVPTQVVDRAIVAGAHTVHAVARVTSAGTSCGTCKLDTELLIEYRLRPLA